MKLATIALLLAAIAAVAQEPSNGEKLARAYGELKCQAAKSKLDVGDIRSLSNQDLGDRGLEMRACVAHLLNGVAQPDWKAVADYQRLASQLYEHSNARISRFAIEKGWWDDFLAWDLDPANRE